MIEIRKERVVTLGFCDEEFNALDKVLEILTELDDVITNETDGNECLASFIMESNYNGDFYDFMESLTDCYSRVEDSLAEFLDERTVIE